MEETKLLDECDVVVPVNKIADYLEFVNKTGEECGLVIKSFGHAGDGNLHIYQCSNDLEEEEFKNAWINFLTLSIRKNRLRRACFRRAWHWNRESEIPGRISWGNEYGPYGRHQARV